MKAVKVKVCVECKSGCTGVMLCKQGKGVEAIMVHPALWRQYRRVVRETRKALKTGVEVTLVNELDKLEEMEAKK